MTDKTKIRVFISYSHEDQKLVKRIVRQLKEIGIVPIFDKSFAFGAGFHEQIRLYIAHSHVFMPVITASSIQRGWVHQEIGFAAALNVPVLPVAFGALPGEMIGQLHAARIDVSIKKQEKTKKKKTSQKDLNRRDLKRLQSILTRKDLVKLIRQSQGLSKATFECAPLPEDRTANMISYAQTVMDLQESVPELAGTSFVRQLGALSSFHIPDLPLKDKLWKRRYGDVPRSMHHCKLQRDERRALTKLAAENGCRLIVNQNIDYADYGIDAQIARLESLLQFLKSDEVAHVEIAFNEDMERGHSLTIVGDWYCAEAVAARAGHGYDQTIFTRHAPSMSARIEAFDELFLDLLGDIKPRDSRYVAIVKINERIEELVRITKESS